MHGLHFRAKSQGQALYISKFGLLSSSQFLCTLTHSPTATNDGGMIAIYNPARPQTVQNSRLASRGGKVGGSSIEREEEKGQ